MASTKVDRFHQQFNFNNLSIEERTFKPLCMIYFYPYTLFYGTVRFPNPIFYIVNTFNLTFNFFKYLSPTSKQILFWLTRVRYRLVFWFRLTEMQAESVNKVVSAQVQCSHLRVMTAQSLSLSKLPLVIVTSKWKSEV